jgi:hypothetical protein
LSSYLSASTTSSIGTTSPAHDAIGRTAMGAAKVIHRTKWEIRWFGTWREVEEVVVQERALTFTVGYGVIEALRLP